MTTTTESFGEQYALIKPNDLFMSIHPAFNQLMQLPMPGGVSYLIGKNFVSVTNAANRINKRRQEKLKGLAEMDDDGKVKFQKVEGQEDVPEFKNREAKEEFRVWDTHLMTETEVEVRTHKIHVKDLDGIQGVPPMILVMLKDFIYDPQAEEHVSKEQLQKETA